jgi:hypothetical protein
VFRPPDAHCDADTAADAYVCSDDGNAIPHHCAVAKAYPETKPCPKLIPVASSHVSTDDFPIASANIATDRIPVASANVATHAEPHLCSVSLRHCDHTGVDGLERYQR